MCTPRPIFIQLNFICVSRTKDFLEISVDNGIQLNVETCVWCVAGTYASITNFSYGAGLSQTGQFHVGFFSFIWR